MFSGHLRRGQIRETLDALPIDLAVVRMAANTENPFNAWLGLGGAARGRSELDAEIQELVICVVTAVDSPLYQYAHHRDAAIAARLTFRQQAAASFASEVRANVRASDETLATARRHLTDRQLIEITLCIGLNMLTSRAAEDAEPQLDDANLPSPGSFRRSRALSSTRR